MKNRYEQYYKDNAGYEMGLYAYSPVSSGKMRLDGILYDGGIDYRTPENYQVYRDCGFNMYLGQVSNHYTGEDWETSVAKRNMDMVYATGIKKFILLDERIYDLSRTLGGVIGEGKKFKNEAELDAYIAKCLEDYKDHPAFYGVQLLDEPRLPHMQPIGQVFKSMQRVSPETFVQCNLFPPFFLFNPGEFMPQEGDYWTRYANYIRAFLDATNASYIQYDVYPLISGCEEGVYCMYFRGMQVAAQVAREYGVNFYIVIQSMTYANGLTSVMPRTLTREDMFWQMNSSLGFGVKQVSYFTYWDKMENKFGGEFFPYGKAMITRDGKKTPLYDYVQEINQMALKLSPVLKDFEYVADAHGAHWPVKSAPFYLREMVNLPLAHVKSFRPDKEVVLINELYDEKRDQYMYRVMNCTDTKAGAETGEQTTEIQFDTKFTHADVFKDGEWQTVELKDGKYTAKLMPGFADYLLIY